MSGCGLRDSSTCGRTGVATCSTDRRLTIGRSHSRRERMRGRGGAGARARDDRRGGAGIDRGSRIVDGREVTGRQLQGHAEDRDHHAADGRRRVPRAGAALLDALRDRRRSRSGSGSRCSSSAATRRSRRGPARVCRRPEDDRRLAARGHDRAGDLGCRRLGEQGAVRCRHRPHLAVRDADVAHAGLDARRRPRRSSGSSRATTSRVRPMRTTWSTS